jgi:hypothetical protein
MTVIYTPYTSLEDAWGPNFKNDKPEKKKKSKHSKQNDPLCDLYSKRYKKVRKPFYTKDNDMIENDYFDKVHSFKGEPDLNHYYGYKDDDFSRLVNKERQKTNNMILDDTGQCIDTNSMKKSFTKPRTKKVKFHTEEEEDDDDVYLRNAIATEEQEEDVLANSQGFDEIVDAKQSSFDRIYSNVYEETDDELVEEELHNVTKDCSSKSLSQMIEEELKNNSYLQLINKERQQVAYIDERQYLDLLMYIFSGIILIFMMEQFIQIGIRMKPPTY